MLWNATKCNPLYIVPTSIYLPLSSTASSSLFQCDLCILCVESGMVVTQVCLGFPRLSYYSILMHPLTSTLIIYISLSTTLSHTLTATFLHIPNLSSLAMLFGDNTNPSQPPSTSTHAHLSPITDSLPAILAADDNTATMLPPLGPPTDIDGATQSSDFLDLLDNGEGACSSKQWMPTQDCPRMFLASCVKRNSVNTGTPSLNMIDVAEC